MSRSLRLGLAAVLCSCTVQIPEGQLECADDSECPPGWSCSANLCYSSPRDGGGGRPDAGDAGRDAGDRSDGGQDAGVDGGPAEDAAVAPQLGAQLATAEVHACARASDGTAWCWGGNVYGQLGDGTTSDRTAPSRVIGLGDVMEVAAQGLLINEAAHSCARLADGTVWCWGRNNRGQLGDGTLVDRSSPVRVGALSDATAIAVGRHHSCAIRVDRSVVCWGSAYSTSPVPVTGLADAVALSAGGVHTCALRSAGGVVCWGANARGQLGDTTTADRRTPVAVAGISDAVAISAGGDASTCAALATGRVMCWGWNPDGELGDRTTVSRSTPAEVLGVTNAVEVSIGASHACARLRTGGMSCWGRNAAGQLGDGSVTPSFAPVLVVSLADVEEIAAGHDFTCARRSSGAIACWGANASGQLGDGTMVSRSTPMAVGGLP